MLLSGDNMSEDINDVIDIEQIPSSIDENELVENEEPESTPDESQNQPKQDKVQKRIDELTRAKYEARNQAEQIARENEQLRAYLQQASEQQPNNENIHELVKQEAMRLKQEDNFNNACNQTYDKGVKEFKDFDNTVKNLQIVGVTREFLDLVSSASDGHKVLHFLGNDLEEANRISRLPPLKMARELTLLEFKLANQKTKVSNAPDPISPISGKSSGKKSPAEMTDAEYAKWRNSK